MCMRCTVQYSSRFVRTDAAELHRRPDAFRSGRRETREVRSGESAGRREAVITHERRAAADSRQRSRRVRHRILQSRCARRIAIAGDRCTAQQSTAMNVLKCNTFTYTYYYLYCIVLLNSLDSRNK